MQVRVRLFASLREAVGREWLSLGLPEGASVEEVWRQLSGEHPALLPSRNSLSAAVNRRYSSFEAPLRDGDEVVFIPPVSGG
jgi:molybdopterin converting factor subunit 1